MAEALPSSSKSSSVTTRSVDESVYNIKHVGRVTHQIVGAKLPSKRQILQVFFFHMRVRKFSAKESRLLAAKEVLLFWEKARIPTQFISRCVDKLEKLYNTWDKLNKTTAEKAGEKQKRELELFVEELDNLFDIAHADALKTIKKQEDRDFLESQRKKGREGSMIGIDRTLAGKEQRKADRIEKEQQRKRKYNEMMQRDGMNI